MQDVLNSPALFGESSVLKDEYGLILKGYQRSVPNIWIGQKQIGGCEDFMKISDEDVKEQLKAAGAL